MTRLPRLPRHVVALDGARAYLDRWAAVTVVQGIQGYGKTTLVSSWLREQSDRVAFVWVAARHLGEDPGAFDRLLADEIRRADLPHRHEPGHPNPSAAPSLDPGDMINSNALRLLDHEASVMPNDRRLVVVIDDAHEMRDHALLTELVDVIGRHRHLHLIVCSRGRHPIIDVTAGRIDTVTIPARKLLFSGTEIGELAALLGAMLTAEQGAELQTAFGGWVAAVRLVLEEVEGSAYRLPLTRATHYLREVVLPEIGDRDTLREVMRFSLPGRLTHGLIRDLSERHPDPVRLVESPGLAERAYAHDDVELVFPTFVRTSLMDHFAATDPEAVRTMHRRLAHWYTEHPGPDHHLHAMHHAVAGADWGQLDEIWGRHSNELAFTQLDALASVIAHVPGSVMATRPGLGVAAEMSRAAATVDPGQDRGMVIMRAYVDASRRAAAQGWETMRLHDLLYVGTGHFVGLRLAGQFVEAHATARLIHDTTLARCAHGEDPGDRLPWFHLNHGLTQTLQARNADAARSYQLCWGHRSGDTMGAASRAASNLALTHALGAEQALTRRWLESYHQMQASAEGEPMLDAGARIAHALLRLDALDLEPGDTVPPGLDDGSGEVELWPFLAFTRAQFDLHLGDPAVGLARLDAAQRGHSPTQASGPAARLLLTRARADLLLAAGKGHHARVLLDQVDAAGTPILSVPLSRLALLSGNPHEACRIAANLLWQDTLDNRSRVELLLIKALAAHRMGQDDMSAEMTRGAVALARQTRLIRPFVTLAEEDLTSLFDLARDSLPDGLASRVRSHRAPFPQRIELVELTRRERLLVQALASNASRQEIADALYVSVNTVRSQLNTLYRKLHANTRDQALARLAQLGLTPAAENEPAEEDPSPHGSRTLAPAL